MNLDNRKEAQPIVQVPREITTTNGCKVTRTFAEKEDPNLQHDVAEMLLAAFIKRRSMLYEASALPVQSVHQRTGEQEEYISMQCRARMVFIESRVLVL